MASDEGLAPAVQSIVRAAIAEQQGSGHTALGTHHWLVVLAERLGPMAETLTEGLNAAALGPHLRGQLRQGVIGEPLSAETATDRARERARARGAAQAFERDLAAVILEAAGYRLAAGAGAGSARPSPAPAAPAAAGPSPAPAPAASATGDAAVPAASYRARATRPTPTLDQFGRDLTKAALDGVLTPFVGREAEIELAVETLCRRIKRNPVLVGPAGVGKTAIVEGLAQRVVAGLVPALLQNVRIVELQPSSLVAGSGLVGELQQRMKGVLAEGAQDGIILFIDEVHSLVGAGGMTGTTDVASLLKPALARGDLACIGATTDDEYRRFIEPDNALERRFQPIRVQELGVDQTLAVLARLAEQLARVRGVQVPASVQRWLVDFAGRFLRNRHFPDKAVDLLEQCVAHAVARGKSVAEQADAETVAQRMVGQPVTLETGREALAGELAARTRLSADDQQALLGRLAVTLRGLDVRSARPNAVVLLVGEAASQSEALGDAIARSLLGGTERVVAIDFSRFVTAHDVSQLIGAAPGYVGYSDQVAFHRVAQMPWCVVRCENVHACHPQVREVLARTLAEGVLTDARGKRIYFSDTVVILTAGGVGAIPRLRVRGFSQAPEETEGPAPRDLVRAELGDELVAVADVICADLGATGPDGSRWIEDALLAELAERYRKQGLAVTWDASLVEWLRAQQRGAGSQRDWERVIDERLSPLLLPHLPRAGSPETRALALRAEGGRVVIDAQPSERRTP